MSVKRSGLPSGAEGLSAEGPSPLLWWTTTSPPVATPPARVTCDWGSQAGPAFMYCPSEDDAAC